jgi:2-methylcitrate dehydratase
MTTKVEETVSETGWDNTVSQLAAFASGFGVDDLTADAIVDAKRRLIDTLGCAYGGYDNPPAVIARELASDYHGARESSVLGMGSRTTTEMAAFANGIMIRALDFNDVNKGLRAGGHPSDVIPAVLAVADAYHLSGRHALLGLVVAYQGYGSIPVHIKKRGWDQGILVGVGVAMGVGAMLGLETDQIANAISLAVTPSAPLAVTRRGDLSMWKNCASAAASQTALFATFLAARGMTGPQKVFEGTHGVWEQLTGEFAVQVDPGQHGLRIGQSDIKCFPSCGSTQAPLSTFIDMTRDLKPDDVDQIEVRTHWDTWFETGHEPEKWDPKSHETADHSLPYVMAVALRDGNVTPASFSDEAIADPALRTVMNKIRIVEDPALTALRPAQTLSDIDIVTRDGRKLTARTDIPRGDHANPLSDSELEKKFRGMAEAVASSSACDRVLERLWALDREADAAAAMETWAKSVEPSALRRGSTHH